MSLERGHRLQAVIEVETGESVNHLEALAQWAHFGKLRAAFHLYVPAGMVDVARRLAEDNHIRVTEIWSYHTVGDEVRFTLVHRSREAPPASSSRTLTERRRPAAPRRKKPAARTSHAATRSSTAARSVKRAKAPTRTQKRK